VLVWTGVAAMHALVPGFWMMFALRIALGIAESPSFPGAAQTVQRILPAAERARGFGVLVTGSSIGGMLAPIVASALSDEWGWRIAFIGTSLLGLVWIPVWIFWTRRPGVPEQLDVKTTTQAERPPVRELLREPALKRGLWAIFAVAPIFSVALHWGPLYLASRFHVKQADIGSYLWLPPVVVDVAMILFGHLASKQHRPHGEPPRLLFAIGMLLGTSLVLLPWMSTAWDAVYLVSISMSGSGICYTLATADLLQRMPAGSVSFSAGMMAAAQSLALVIINPLIGAAVDHFGNFDVATIAVGLWVLPGCIVWLVWRLPQQPSPELPRATVR
jgi:predicted MFS family arabinose efflux permease